MRTILSTKVRGLSKKMKDRGQNMLEYVGLVIIVAAVVVGLAGVLGQIEAPFQSAVESVTNVNPGGGGGDGGGGDN